MSQRILILSAEFGAGHLAAANAIAAAYRSTTPEGEAEPVQVQSPLLAAFTAIYLLLIKHFPSWYRRLYRLRVGWPARNLMVTTLAWTILKAIRQQQPDLIVGTHPFPAGVAAYLRHLGLLQVPVVMALTDFHPHGFWIWPGVDHYFVASTAVADGLVAAGIAPDRITVTGVAIRPEFAEVNAQRITDSNPSPRHILVMGGGLGLGPILEAVRSLAALPHRDLAITVVCGRNRRLQEEARVLFAGDPRIRIMGYTPHVLDHMMESDLLVTKPGGITCSEAMALGLPMLLLNPLPGHEEENAEYLVKIGAARITDETWVGQEAAALLFDNPELLRAMADSSHAHSHARSALAIATRLAPVPVAHAPFSATTI